MTQGNYNSKNFLTAGQKRLFKKLDDIEEGHKILTSVPIQKDGYFASAGSLAGMNKRYAELKIFYDDALSLTYLLFKDETYDEKNLLTVKDTIAGVRALITGVKNTIDSALTGKLNEAGLKEFAASLDAQFPVTKNSTGITAIANMLKYGLFANAYKKVVAMLKNYNPYSRLKKGTGRQGLGNVAPDNSVPSAPYVESVLAKTIKDKGSSPQWILNHINTSLPICCIDKVICLTNDIKYIHSLLAPHVKVTDKINDVLGGSPLSFFNYISFFFNDGTKNLSSARKLRPKIAKTAEGWIVKGVMYPERLNVENELKRSEKSITTGEDRAYQVYFIINNNVVSGEDFSNTDVKALGYSTDYTNEKFKDSNKAEELINTI